MTMNLTLTNITLQRHAAVTFFNSTPYSNDQIYVYKAKCTKNNKKEA